MLEVAKDFPEYAFAVADEDDFASEVKDLGLSESGEDVNAAILAEGGRRFAMEPTDFDADALREFVTAFQKGERPACRGLCWGQSRSDLMHSPFALPSPPPSFRNAGMGARAGAVEQWVGHWPCSRLAQVQSPPSCGEP